MDRLMTRLVLKVLAWITIIGGSLMHPIIYGLMILHHLDSNMAKFEAYLIPQEFYLMIFGIIGSITGGAVLLILLDIQAHVRSDSNVAKKF